MRRAFVFVVAAACAAVGSGQTAAGDEAAVRKTIETYLHGLKFNDVASFRKAFLPEARLYFQKKDSSLGQLTQEQWYEGFAKVAGQEEPGDLRIAAVDAAASVKVVEIYPKDVYTDYLNLLRLQGEWKIVNKIYVVEKR